MMELKETLFALSAAAGPTGLEGEAAALGAQLLEPLAERVERDSLGNVYGWRFSKKPNAKTLLLDAHLDEVALVVTGQEKGFLTFAELNSGIDPRILPGLRVKVLAKEPFYGVITCLPPHILSKEEQDKAFPMDRLRIDAGLSPEEAKAALGAAVVYATRPFSLAGTRVCGKSLDDRACFVMFLRVLELLKDRELPVSVCLVGSTQEESSGVGCKTSAYTVNPDFALVSDVTFGRTPDSPAIDTFPLGSGPAIGVGPILHRKFTNKLIACAKRLKIPYTLEISPGNTGTNAMQTQVCRMGVPTAQVSVPLQYMHTPLEVIDLADLEQSAKLIAEFILSCGEGAMA